MLQENKRTEYFEHNNHSSQISFLSWVQAKFSGEWASDTVRGLEIVMHYGIAVVVEPQKVLLFKMSSYFLSICLMV